MPSLPEGLDNPLGSSNTNQELNDRVLLEMKNSFNVMLEAIDARRRLLLENLREKFGYDANLREDNGDFERGREPDLFHTGTDTLRKLRDLRFGVDNFNSLLKEVQNFGFFVEETKGHSFDIIRTDFVKAKIGENFVIMIEAKDEMGRKRNCGGDVFDALIESMDGSNAYCFPKEITDHTDGTYSISIPFNQTGNTMITIVANGEPILKKPLLIYVNPSDESVPKYSIRRGSTDSRISDSSDDEKKTGSLSHPWGVCCDLDGNIFVGDRWSNQVKIFNSNLEIIMSFGLPGTNPGYFDHPSGLTYDKNLRRLIVVDKDNHRIQVFSINDIHRAKSQLIEHACIKGVVVKPLFVFGQHGYRDGYFRYPWDVAVNYDSQIVISDTKNYRLQLFDQNGSFLSKYGGGMRSATSTISPRGVAFTQDNRIVTTDFDRHHIIILDINMRLQLLIGTAGNPVGCLMRPQGVDVDANGYIIVADSRNYRIQVFGRDGFVKHVIGRNGSGEGDQMDRPCGVCVSPQGSLLVVDFGNDRLLSFS
ncbi:hypothetical protein ACOME3_003971 [Neoechinorhynchus agilis]